MRWQDERSLVAEHVTLGSFTMQSDVGPDGQLPQWLFTENETNFKKVFGLENAGKYVKDAFHDYVIRKEHEAVNASGRGTKAAAYYVLNVPAGGRQTVRLRLSKNDDLNVAGTFHVPSARQPFGLEFEETFAARINETDEYYASRLPAHQTTEQRAVARQAYAGLLWSKQFYFYAVKPWLDGDPDQPSSPGSRKGGRNRDWQHLFNRDVISMPDKWEYPWYAAWDLAFHMLPFARVDPDFSKEQLVLLLREWYMHPNGQMPAYEFAFGDVNPPVHAWACWRVYKMTGKRGERDRVFLARTFNKLLINFTWWVNRKDLEGNHLFAGGFLGLDNIGVFDRSKPLPTGGRLEQADGTAWMAFYCATMLSKALELAAGDPAYEDIASKFFEHFVAISDAMNCLGGTGLWDEQDGFYYDVLQANGVTMPLRIRSMVGIIPLFTCEVLETEVINRLPDFKKRMDWFLQHRKDLARHITPMANDPNSAHVGKDKHSLLAIPSRERLTRVLKYVFDENEFLSEYGIRALSRVHQDRPFVFSAGGEEHRVDYVPGESTSGLFGGNSNWRGPIWFPVNYLLVEALERYHYFYGDSLLIEYPTGSGRKLNLKQIAQDLAQRLTKLFLPDENGRRACHGTDEAYANDPHWRDLVLFYEYFHGDSGRGVGASHQTGWTALVARLLEKSDRG